MNCPDTTTDAQISECLDAHPAIEARAILASGRILKAREVLFLCPVSRAPKIAISYHFARSVMDPLVDHIHARWYYERLTPMPAGEQVHALAGGTKHSPAGTGAYTVPDFSSPPLAGTGAGTQPASASIASAVPVIVVYEEER